MRLYQVRQAVKRRGPGLQQAILVLVLLLLWTGPIPGGEPPREPTAMLADDLDGESLRVAIQRSVSYLEKLSPERIVGTQPRRFTAKQVLDALRAFEPLVDRWNCQGCWMKDFAARFELVPSSSDPALETVLFSGYYQPVIEASLVATPEYRYPIYARPADLVTAEQMRLTPALAKEKVSGRVQGESWLPYYSRREIEEQGSLRGRGYELAWVKDSIELFFLHIQGSGILQLPDGRRLSVGYAGGNGRPYRSIGRLLIDRGRIPKEEMSMQRLRRYLAEHPDEQSEIFAHNESYIFFRFLSEGPLGHLEVPLTPDRSIATDSEVFPKGALALMVSQRPILDGAGQLIGWRPFSRFVLNQDTGAAIRGPQRVDLYFGTGAEAGAAAGFMNRPGKLYFLALKDRPASPQSRR